LPIAGLLAKVKGYSGRVEDILVNIEAAELVSGRVIMRNTGVFFFAEDVRHFFPQAYVTCLLAKGADKADILDRKDYRLCSRNRFGLSPAYQKESELKGPRGDRYEIEKEGEEILQGSGCRTVGPVKRRK
jgi:hypothetical protein